MPIHEQTVNHQIAGCGRSSAIAWSQRSMSALQFPDCQRGVRNTSSACLAKRVHPLADFGNVTPPGGSGGASRKWSVRSKDLRSGMDFEASNLLAQPQTLLIRNGGLHRIAADQKVLTKSQRETMPRQAPEFRARSVSRRPYRGGRRRKPALSWGFPRAYDRR